MNLATLQVTGRLRFLATAVDGRVYAFNNTKQYPLAVEHIGKKLDALELESKVALSAELRRVRSDLAAKIKTAKGPQSFKVLPRRKELQKEMGAMLRRAWDAGSAAIRDEVGVARHYDASSFTPVGAIKWLLDSEFWITDVLADDLLSAAQRIIVNGLKTGAPTSVMMGQLFQAFVPYLGGNVGDAVISPSRLETIVRTNTTTAYNHGRLTEMLGADVAPFVDGARWESILDSRTTEVCKFLSGYVFALPRQADDLEALLPPRHFNCRSIILPIVVGSPINPDDVIMAEGIAHAKSLSDPSFKQRGAFRNYGDAVESLR